MNRYEMVALWEGELFAHWTYTYAEALEWARQYPMEARCRVWDVVRGECVGRRG